MSELVEVLDENQFQKILQSDLPVLVDFWAPWCNPCKSLMPIVSAIAKQYAGQVIFVKVNIDQLFTIASRYNIGSIPHCILFQGGKPLGALSGLQPSGEFINFLKHHLPALREPL